MKDNSIYIDHIKASIDRIQQYIAGFNRNSFLNDLKTQDAVVRQLEIIGEATKKVSFELREKYSSIPWLDMAGMRDRLVHDYIDVDMEIVWKTASEDIPKLKELLSQIK